jgi:hypothetical protein
LKVKQTYGHARDLLYLTLRLTCAELGARCLIKFLTNQLLGMATGDLSAEHDDVEEEGSDRLLSLIEAVEAHSKPNLSKCYEHGLHMHRYC